MKNGWFKPRAVILLCMVLLASCLLGIAAAQPADAYPPAPAQEYGVVWLDGGSNSQQTAPFLMWVADQPGNELTDAKYVYFAIKTTHLLTEVTIGLGDTSVTATDFTVDGFTYDEGQFIYIDGQRHDPALNLQGSVKKARWYIARFDGPNTPGNVLTLAQVDGDLAFTIMVNDAGGHSIIAQTYTLTPYTGNRTATKRWSGGPAIKPEVWFKLYREIPAPAGGTSPILPREAVNVAPRAIPNGQTSTTWTGIDITDLYGRMYVFSVEEGTMVNGQFVAGTPGNYEKLENGMMVTNTWLTRRLTARKAWVPSAPAGATVQLQLLRSIAGSAALPEAVETVTLNGIPDSQEGGLRPDGSGETQAWSYTWAALPQKDDANNPYNYAIAEIDWPASYLPAITGDMATGFTVTNTFQSTSLKARKDYVVDPQASPQPAVPYQKAVIFLDRNGEHYLPSREFANGEEYTWTGLPMYADKEGKVPYSYAAVEPIAPLGFVMSWKVDDAGTWVITNTWRAGAFTARKVWDPAPAGSPLVQLELWQRIVGNDTYERFIRNGSVSGNPLPAGTPIDRDGEYSPWTYTWIGLQANGTYQGNLVTYKYEIRETQSTVPAGYAFDAATSASRVAVNRALSVPFTATKIWEGGSRPAVTYRLMRSFRDSAGTTVTEAATYPGSATPITAVLDGTADNTSPGELAPVDANTWQYRWEDLPRYKHPDTFSGAFTYYVEENVPDNYSQSPVNGSLTATFTNRYIPSVKDITANKVWIGGPRPTVYFRLYRHQGTDITSRVPVPEAGVTTVPPVPPYTVTWKDVQQTDINGVPYVFSVVEVDQQGLPFVPENYAAAYSMNGETYVVTNTYTIPKGPVRANKVWMDGPGPRPTIWFQLYRKLSVGDPGTVVPGVQPFELPDGDTQASWQNVELTNDAGRPYTFFVREGAMAGGVFTPGAPARYKAHENGLWVHNYYQAQAELTLNIEKQMRGRFGKNPDSFTIVLYQTDSSWQLPADGVAIQGLPLVFGNQPSASAAGAFFPIVYSYDLHADFVRNDLGEHYYLIREVIPAEDPINGITYDTREYRLKVLVELSDTPDGKLKLTATLDNGTPVDVSSGSLGGLVFTNTYAMDVTVSKFWINDQDNRFGLRRPVTLELLQNNASMNPPRTVTLNPTGAAFNEREWPHTFTGLPMQDENGVDYVYTVKEISQVNGYHTSVTGPLSIRNEFLSKQITVNKHWEDFGNAYATRPQQVTVELKQNNLSFDPPVTAVLSAANNWYHVFFNYPRIDQNGVPYSYSVVEEAVAGYQSAATVQGDSDYLTSINIENTLKSRDLDARKVWDVPAGYELPVGTTVEFTLRRSVAGGTPELVSRVTLDGEYDLLEGPGGSREGNSLPLEWVYQWRGLPKENSLGQEYTYILEETGKPLGFETTMAPQAISAATTEVVVTNKLLTTTLSARKAFAAREGLNLPVPLPALGLALYQNGLPYGDVVTLDGTIDPQTEPDGSGELAAWTYTWAALPVIGPDNTPYVYTVTEPVIPQGFIMEVTADSLDPDGADVLVTNTYLGNVFTAKKEWRPSGVRPPAGVSVVFQLQRVDINDVVVDIGGEVTLNGTIDPGLDFTAQDGEFAPWSYIWHNLDTHDALDNAYKYQIKEIVPVDETGYFHDTVSSASTVAVNYNLKTEFTATKLWAGGPKPPVTFELWRSWVDGSGSQKQEQVGDINGSPLLGVLDGTGQGIGDATGELVPVNADTWRYKWVGLDRYASITETPDGPALVQYNYYVVERLLDPVTNEPLVPSYTQEYQPGRLTAHTILNRYTIPRGSFSIEKTWGQYGYFPDNQFVFRLYRTYTPMGATEPVTELVPASDGGSYVYASTNVPTITWNYLALTTLDGTPYTFTAEEGIYLNGNFSAVLPSAYSVAYEYDAEGTLIAAHNTYTAKGSMAPFFYKQLMGRPIREGEFRFTLTPLNGAPANKADGTAYTPQELTVVNQAARTGFANTADVIFPELHFTEADIGKAYQYEVVEVAGSEAGMTYSDLKITLNVHVYNLNNNGELEVHGVENGTTFANQYRAAGYFNPLISKELTGRALKDGEFVFAAFYTENFFSLGSNDAQGNILFDPQGIYFNQEHIGNTYPIKIREIPQGNPAITYDPMEMEILVKVTDAGNGELAFEATYPVDTVFNNTYHPASGTAAITGTKVLSGRDIRDGEFSFVLYEQDRVVSRATNLGGTFTLQLPTYRYDPDATVQEAGVVYLHSATQTFNYTLVEDTSALPGGVTHQAHAYPIKVTVTYTKGNPALAIRVTDINDMPLDITFHNDYRASGTLRLQGGKAMDGRALNAQDYYTFSVLDGTDLIATGSAAGAGGEIAFTDIAFDLHDVARSPITLLVRENASTIGGVTADTAEFQVIVSLSDKGDGTLELQTAHPDGELSFTNTYAATGTLVLSGRKTLLGREMTADDVFTFRVLDGSELLATGTNNGTAQIAFPAITFDLDDLARSPLELSIVEETTGIAGIAADPLEHKVVVTLTDNLDGTLDVALAYPDEHIGLEFVNQYRASGAYAPSAVKRLDGRALAAGEFTFTLTAQDDAPLRGPDGQAYTQAQLSVQNAAPDAQNEGAITFPALHFTQEDAGSTYTYQIHETPGSLEGVSYAARPLTFHLSVTDLGNGVLDITPRYEGERVFLNTYEAAGVLRLQGIKVMAGRELTADDNYTFTVRDGDTVIATGANNGTGTITFTPVNYTLADVALSPITLRVTEDSAAVPDVATDPQAYEITVTLADGGDGSVLVSAAYPTGGLVFQNVYSPEELLDIAVTKTWSGGPEADHQPVELSLYRSVPGGEPTLVLDLTPDIQPAQGPAERFAYTWRGLPLQDADGQAYSYFVRETGQENGRVLINGNLYLVTMSGTDITNTYLPPDAAQYTVTAQKRLTGARLRADQFAFQLEGEGHSMTVRNDADGLVTFPPLVFTAPGEYTYTIRELNEGRNRFTYDSRVYTLRVAVTLEGSGNALQTAAVLTVDGETPANDILFLNSYTPEPDPAVVPIQVHKRVEGMELKAGEYSFKLYDYPGTELQTVTNLSDGSVVFSPLLLTGEGTHLFTVREVAGADPGIQYDDSIIQVRVTLTESAGGFDTEITYRRNGVPVAYPVFVNTRGMPPTGDPFLRLPLILLGVSALSGLGYLVVRKRVRHKGRDES